MVTYSSIDAVFPTDVAFTSTGGSRWKTAVVETGGGQEQRIQEWDQSKGDFDIAYGILELDRIQRVKDFAEARRGMLQGFCLFFHEDFQAEDMPLAGIHNETDFSTHQLIKEYFDGPDEWQPNQAYVTAGALPDDVRIMRTKADRVRPTVYASQVFVAIQDGTSGGTEPTWNTDLGSLTADGGVVWTCVAGPDVYSKIVEKPIPGTVEPLTVDDVAQVEGTDYVINYSTGVVTFTPGVTGEIRAPYFEFYLKVRFANDHMPIQQDLKGGGSIRSIPLIELRQDVV